MTWGEFSWADLHPDRRRDRHAKRPRAVMVPGEPVPWMESGEDSWALKVGRALPTPLDRPFFTFVLPEHQDARRRALDDYMQPIMDVRRRPTSASGHEPRRGSTPDCKSLKPHPLSRPESSESLPSIARTAVVNLRR